MPEELIPLVVVPSFFLLIGLIIYGQYTGVSILGKLIWPFVKFFARIFGGV